MEQCSLYGVIARKGTEDARYDIACIPPMASANNEEVPKEAVNLDFSILDKYMGKSTS